MKLNAKKKGEKMIYRTNKIKLNIYVKSKDLYSVPRIFLEFVLHS